VTSRPSLGRPDAQERRRRGVQGSFNGTGLIRAAHADIAGRRVQAHIKINHINNLGWTALLEAVILGDGSKRY
jgi:uncharacterized protein